MDLKEKAKEINELLENRRNDISLSFIEENHIYFMKDKNGVVRSNFPSVSSVLEHFYEPFDANSKALDMCNGNVTEQQKLLEQWSNAGKYATNMGSRVHYELEKELILRNGDYKEVRQPIFEVDEQQTITSDAMIKAGIDYIKLMESRGAVLLDTEIVLGDNDFGYTGQPDKVWLMETRDKSNFGIVVTDWKTNQPKNFLVHHYTGMMFPPFSDYPDTSLTHYYIQIPLYAKLILKMLKGTKYENIPFIGGVVVLLKKEGVFEEYRIPNDVIKKVIDMDITTVLNK